MQGTAILVTASLILYRTPLVRRTVDEPWPWYCATCHSFESASSWWNCDPMTHVDPTPSPDLHVIRPSHLLGLFAATETAAAGKRRCLMMARAAGKESIIKTTIIFSNTVFPQLLKCYLRVYNTAYHFLNMTFSRWLPPLCNHVSDLECVFPIMRGNNYVKPRRFLPSFLV
jgi:hypothetical protein